MLQDIIYKKSWYWVFLIGSVSCARILGIFPIEGRSHFNFHETMMKSLVSAGHQVTLIAPFQPQNVHENLTIINSIIAEKSPSTVAAPSQFWILLGLHITDIMEQDCLNIIKLEEIKALKNFDILFVEMLPIFQCYLPVAKKLNIPVIGTISTRSIVESDYSMGYSRFPSVFPTEWYCREPKMSFYERIKNFINEIEIRIVKFWGERKVVQIYDKYFHDHERNSVKISLLFANNHASFLPRSAPPNVINIGGLYVKSSLLTPLPEDLKRFIEGSKHGVILFSFGSIVTKDTLSPELRTVLKNTFAKIPQRVIWKFDGQIEGLTENILLSKWMPQKEILAHKNVLAFISHCGLGSTYEAIYFGKPMILVPVFADQPGNAAIVKSFEAGLYIDFEKLNEINLLDAIDKVINGTKYRENMADLSSRFRDEPMASAELVKYWTEYVLKHKGALHLRPAEADMPLYQFLLVDVIILILFVAPISSYLSVMFTKFLFTVLFNFLKRFMLALRSLKFCKTEISIKNKKL